MSPSEIAFLVFGLVLGAAMGAALIQVVRARPAPLREVRVTITPNAIPARRAHTLAVPHGTAHPGPIPGSPEEAALANGVVPGADHGFTTAAGPSITRTRVSSAGVVLPASVVAVPVVGDPASTPREAWAYALQPLQPRGATPLVAASAVAVLDAPISRAAPGRDDPFTTSVPPGPPEPLGPPDAVGAADDPAADTGPCSGLRHAVDERCALARVAHDQARLAGDAFREAQRAYDILRERMDRAAALADPRQVAATKEGLHAAFRAASARSRTSDETEAAARAWLNEINALNTAVRDAHRIVEAGTVDLRDRLPALERLAAEAGAARIAGENAEAGCHEAREALADCEEAAARARDAAPRDPEEPHPFAGVWPTDDPELPAGAASSPAQRMAGLPAIVRVLRGDREAHERLVATLAAGDPEADKEWQLRIARLLDAITGRSIEDGYLDPAEDHPFWRLFGHRETRDIIGALSALGFRYDGLGGFADGRAPAARDLSLAVGYAGLDRMRIRTWPRDSEIAVMYSGVTVATDEWLADQAGDLTLGRMVDALGNRAADLADLWNAWGRVRPALVAS